MGQCPHLPAARRCPHRPGKLMSELVRKLRKPLPHPSVSGGSCRIEGVLGCSEDSPGLRPWCKPVGGNPTFQSGRGMSFLTRSFGGGGQRTDRGPVSCSQTGSSCPASTRCTSQPIPGSQQPFPHDRLGVHGQTGVRIGAVPQQADSGALGTALWQVARLDVRNNAPARLGKHHSFPLPPCFCV